MGPESLIVFSVFCDWLLSTGARGPLPLVSKRHYPLLPTLLRLPWYVTAFYHQVAEDAAANTSTSFHENVAVPEMVPATPGEQAHHQHVSDLANATAEGMPHPAQVNTSAQQWKTVSANTSYSDISVGKVMASLIATIPPVTRTPLPVLNNTMLRSIVRCLYACSVFIPTVDQRQALKEANIVFDMSSDEIESVRSTTMIADANDTAMPSRGRRLDSTTFLKGHEHHSQLSPVSAAFKSAITDVTALFAKLTGSDRSKQHEANDATIHPTSGPSYVDPSAGTLTKVLAKRALLRLRDRADMMGELEIAMACKIYQQFD